MIYEEVIGTGRNRFMRGSAGMRGYPRRVRMVNLRFGVSEKRMERPSRPSKTGLTHPHPLRGAILFAPGNSRDAQAQPPSLDVYSCMPIKPPPEENNPTSLPREVPQKDFDGVRCCGNIGQGEVRVQEGVKERRS